MKSSTLGTVPWILTTAIIIKAQKFNITESINAFSLNLLWETTSQAGDSLNVAISPYTVWSLMTILSEGAMDNTARQLENALGIPMDKTPVRSSFQNLSNTLLAKADGVNLESNMAIFINEKYPVRKSFQAVSDQYYKAAINPVNFTNPSKAANDINRYVSQATKNRLTALVDSADVTGAYLFLTSVLYFKGQWKMSFNTTETRRETFYDEQSNKIGEVSMMFQAAPFPYSQLEDIGAQAIELPYGLDRKLSMIVILPYKGETLTCVWSRMSQKPFSYILRALQEAEETFGDDDVHVYLPKFKVSSDFNLNVVLIEIGIKDVFDPDRASLLDMFYHYIYLSRLIQKAEIEVDEKGTVPVDAPGISQQNKPAPPVFKANKPFLYFIVDKLTSSIIFAGKIANPNTLD